ncbi:hypothetical protein [Hungatella sp.]|uniref:hypothetical protein n=1 Tax=Hungatella sp. TaxID=2613924 RepID=UPI0039946793
MVGLILVAAVLFATIFANFLTPYDYSAQSFGDRFVYPCLAHPFGTDQYGAISPGADSFRRPGVPDRGTDRGCHFSGDRGRARRGGRIFRGNVRYRYHACD